MIRRVGRESRSVYLIYHIFALYPSCRKRRSRAWRSRLVLWQSVREKPRETRVLQSPQIHRICFKQATAQLAGAGRLS
jgi:hypothetical protein